jgi:short-subunit dehydrogenase involved in D-alanine esterification of teichoic acids
MSWSRFSQDSYQWNTVLVTGGGNGLGRAFAQHFLAKGKVRGFPSTLSPSMKLFVSQILIQKVIIAGRTRDNLQQTASEIKNDRLHVVELDTGDISSISSFVTQLLEAHDDLDCLVNNAGVMEPLDLHSPGIDVEAALAKADSEMDVNARGVVHLTVRLLPQIRKRRGTIMNVSSLLALTPMVETPIYSGMVIFARDRVCNAHSW